jgi:hypothetical protein
VAVSKLPSEPLARGVVAIGDTKVEYRALSRSEVLELAKFEGDPNGGETHVVACGAEVTPEEAAEWRNTTAPETVGVLVDAILELSKLTEGAQKSNGTGDSPGG